MSAYIVDKKHILYLVSATLSHQLQRAFGSSFTWVVDDPTQPGGYRCGRLYCNDYAQAVDVANLLWRENIASVSHRYPNESSADLPGPGDGDYVITEADLHGIRFAKIDPVQVLKACDCFEYQSCEHRGWKTSEAHAIIQSLRKNAICVLPGYNEAKWGAPVPQFSSAL